MLKTIRKYSITMVMYCHGNHIHDLKDLLSALNVGGDGLSHQAMAIQMH